MAYQENYKDSNDFEILEAGTYVLELAAILGPHQQMDSFNPGQVVDKYYWDFNVYSDDAGTVPVMNESTGEKFSQRIFVSSAEGDKSTTFKLLRALQSPKNIGDTPEQWMNAAIGRKFVAAVQVIETNPLIGEPTKKNKIDFNTGIQPLQTGEVEKEDLSKPRGTPSGDAAADKKLPF